MGADGLSKRVFFSALLVTAFGLKISKKWYSNEIELYSPGLSPEILWRIEVLRSSRRFVVPDDFSSVVVDAVARVGQAVVAKALVFVSGLSTSQLPFMADVIATFSEVVAEMSGFAGTIDQVRF